MEIVLKNVAAGVISIDEKGMITTINTSAEQMLGVQRRRRFWRRGSRRCLAQEYVTQIEGLLTRAQVLPEGFDREAGHAST